VVVSSAITIAAFPLVVVVTLFLGLVFIYFFIGSGYRSSSRPSFLKTYSSAACNMTVTQDKCAADCTTLGRNVVNL